MDPPPLRPINTRKASQIPGSFESDEEASPTKTVYDDAQSTKSHSRHASAASQRSLPFSSDDAPHALDEGSSLDTTAHHKHLMDVESSFLPEGSPETTLHHTPVDDDDSHHTSSQTPPSTTFKTPAAYRTFDDSGVEETQSNYKTDHMTESMLETMSSSPTAAASARVVSRVVSMASMGGYETADEEGNTHEFEEEEEDQDGSLPNDATPTKKRSSSLRKETRGEGATTPTKISASDSLEHHSQSADEDVTPSVKSPRRRPQYLTSRFASQRSSYSSCGNMSNEDVASDLTVALQAGGGLPGPVSSRPEKNLSRTLSLGSVASGISNLSDNEGAPRSTTDLQTLPEESSVPMNRPGRFEDEEDDPKTPRTSHHNISTPTDTVINQKVQDFEVPGTIARRFQDREGNPSPERKLGAPTPAPAKVKNLTLKEQSSMIDKLQKEVWKLKLKLYFMDQTMAERSDESVKAMISENVELKTHKFSTSKEIRALKREIRQLEFKLKERDETVNGLRAEAKEKDRNASGYTEGAAQELETEVIYLRERMETYEVEIERLRTENITKEGEKKRLAEVVRKATERPTVGSDVGLREEVELWKDLLEAESARKEQADEENRALREELWRLKENANSTLSTNRSYELFPPRPRSSRRPDSSHTNGGSSSTLVDQLRHENAELKREVGAQASMLGSRNKEKERLYQEIEDLKMGLRRGDSILDRSVSRAHQRSSSRTSSQTRATQMGDSEREALETANGDLRDQLASQKLDNQELSRQLDAVLDELEQLEDFRVKYTDLEQKHGEFEHQANEELLRMQRERDEALRELDQIDNKFDELQAEAQERLYVAEEQLDERDAVLAELQQKYDQRDADTENLRNEVRMTAEGLVRVEADVQDKIKRINELQQRNGELELQNEDLTQELETIDDNLNQSASKCEKLSVELESRVSECAFLREEQDGTMLRIGDLENSLKATQASLTAEKDKAKDLENRLADERHQREVIGSKEKQDVQKIMNELNREAAASKDESRKLRKVVEQRETELKTWKERLVELESGLKEMLGDGGSSKQSFFTAIGRLQRNLEDTSNALEETHQKLSEKERRLQSRDDLLESHALESRKLSDLLEKERAGRRSERVQHEQWQKSHQHTSRTVSQKDARITELESSRSSDRKRLTNLENQFRDQLHERNALLLSLWSKLSTLCGSDWQHQNNLVSGHLPTLDVVERMLPAFSKNLLHAVRTIEHVVSGFRARVKGIERDLNKDYQQLEHNLDLRIKRLDRLESAVQVSKISGAANAAPEIAKLRGENRLLKSEITQLQQAEKIRKSTLTSVQIERASSSSQVPTNSSFAHANERGVEQAHGRSSQRPGSGALARGYTTSAVETTESQRNAGEHNMQVSGVSQQEQLEPNNQRWIHRLRELEKRLKMEREARLLDRKGAKSRLEQGEQENKELRAELERERDRRKAKEDDEG